MLKPQVPKINFCNKCKTEKSLGELVKDSSRLSGYKKLCKTCDSLRKKSNYTANRDEILLEKREFRKDNGDEVRRKRNEWHSKHKNDINYKESRKRSAEKRKEQDRVLHIEYHKQNREKICNRSKQWRLDNPDRYKKTLKESYIKNKEKRLKDCAEYKKKNPGRVAAWNAKREAQKKEASPHWLTEIQLKEIEQIYIKCSDISKTTGIKHEVDHIVPLQGKHVSGLHVPWNLQILTKSENSSKNNRFDI